MYTGYIDKLFYRAFGSIWRRCCQKIPIYEKNRPSAVALLLLTVAPAHLRDKENNNNEK